MNKSKLEYSVMVVDTTPDRRFTPKRDEENLLGIYSPLAIPEQIPAVYANHSSWCSELHKREAVRLCLLCYSQTEPDAIERALAERGIAFATIYDSYDKSKRLDYEKKPQLSFQAIKRLSRDAQTKVFQQLIAATPPIGPEVRSIVSRLGL